MTPQRAFLIDGTAFGYRAFYAIRSLSTSDGRPTNAVYGFAMMLQALRQKERPDYLAVAFDVGKPTFRHQKFEAYKVQRKPMPDALIGQWPLIKTLLAAYRIPVFEQPGYEAEDVLATMAQRIAGAHLEVMLVTGDKDALQLVNSHIKVYNPHRQDVAVLDAAAVRARYGVEPEQMVDLMALMGDEIDNIPGVPGIGEKTARQLIARFGSLEALRARLAEVTPVPRRQQLAASWEQIELARTLAQIERHVPLTIALETLKVQEPDWRALRALFRELEFKRLLQAVDGQDAGTVTPSAAHAVHAVRSERDLQMLVSQLPRTTTPAAVLCWAASPSAGAAEPPAVILAISCSPQAAWVIELTRALAKTPAGQRVAQWLQDPAATKISHDAKSAKRLLGNLGLALNGIGGDTMIAAYLLNPARTTQTLSDVSDEHLGHPLAAMPPVAEHGEISSALEAACGDHVSALLELHAVLLTKLNAAHLSELYHDMELPLLDVLAHMEVVGVAVDVPHLAGLRASMDATLARLTDEITQLAGCAFNMNSPKQLAQILFERLRLPVIKRTKTGPSTDSDVLRRLAAQHPLPERLMQYREVAKLKSTYIEALPALVDPRTGRLHTSFNQTATATGRLSSSEPNLQNIPIKTELGRSIRRAFIAGIPEGALLVADYSQIELRILAHLSGDERLTDAFRQGHDIHRATASLIYGIPETEVQPVQRNAMKAINFGILYGMSAHGLSKELDSSFEEAQTFIDAYFDRYPKVRRYLDEQIQQARRDGFVQTLLGRRRYVPEVNSPDPATRQVGERMTINAPIQGTAADLIKRAMVQIAAALSREGFAARMVLQVHDELVFETPRHELARLAALVRRLMEGAIAMNVPLIVTMKAGPNWLDLTDASA